MKRYMNLLVIVVISVFIFTGCQQKVENVIIEPSTEENVSENNNESINDAKELDIKPLKREEILSGGIPVVTPVGYKTNEFELSKSGDSSIIMINTPGLEWHKTYQIKFSGNSTSGDTDITLNLLDGTGTIIYTENVKVESVFEYETELTLTTPTMNNGQIQLLSPSPDFTINKFEITRILGKQIFSDEFDQDGLPDTSKWSYEIGGNGWGNAELQYYTNGDSDNTYIADGYLTIKAIEETINTNSYSSARLVSNTAWTYGRYEIKARLPYGRGTWPAIWMLPKGNQYGNWPNSGEIDIMEHVGFDMDVVHGSLHTGDFNFRKGWHPTSEMKIPNVDTQDHVYTLEWSPYQIDMYIDDYLYLTYINDGQGSKHWPFDQNFYLLMNIAVGGGWGGQQGVDPIFPQEMNVDYVRVYELADKVVDNSSPDQIEDISYTINGSMVDLTWASSKDDYLVVGYEVIVEDLKTKNTTTYLADSTSLSLLSLDGDSSYNISVLARDQSGNLSNPSTVEIRTEPIEYLKVGEVVSVEDTTFLKNIELKGDAFKYLDYIDQGDLFGYAYRIEKSGDYKLVLEVSGNLFKGLIVVKNNKDEILTQIETPKTNGWDDYTSITSETLKLDKGNQVLLCEVEKSGFRVKSIQLVKID